MWIPWSFLSYSAVFWIHLVRIFNRFHQNSLRYIFKSNLSIKYHPSNIRGFCLMKWPSEMFQNLPYFRNMKSEIPGSFFLFHFENIFRWFWFFWITHPIRYLGALSKRDQTYVILFLGFTFDSWTLGRYELMASFVDNTCANLALVTLFSKAPNEIAAVRTKSRLT